MTIAADHEGKPAEDGGLAVVRAPATHPSRDVARRVQDRALHLLTPCAVDLRHERRLPGTRARVGTAIRRLDVRASPEWGTAVRTGCATGAGEPRRLLRCATQQSEETHIGARSTQLLGAGLVALVLVLGAAGCGSGSSGSTSFTATTSSSAGTSGAARGPGSGKPAFTLGTKNFTEELILGELYAQALRAKGFKVNLKPDIGASEVVARDLAGGHIDGYPEYTGTILSAVAHDARRPVNAAQAYSRAAAYERAHGAALLAMAPAEDKDVLATTPAYAARQRLKSLATCGGSAPPRRSRDRRNSGGGSPAWSGSGRHTASPNSDSCPWKSATQYAALHDGRAQVAAVFTTDGRAQPGRLRAAPRPAQHLRLPERHVRRPARRPGARGPRLPADDRRGEREAEHPGAAADERCGRTRPPESRAGGAPVPGGERARVSASARRRGARAASARRPRPPGARARGPARRR